MKPMHYVIIDTKTKLSFQVLPYLLVPARKRGVKQARISRKIAGDQFFMFMQVKNLKKLSIQKIYLLSSYNDTPAFSRTHISIFDLYI